jgi:hypothetical protein
MLAMYVPFGDWFDCLRWLSIAILSLSALLFIVVWAKGWRPKAK